MLISSLPLSSPFHISLSRHLLLAQQSANNRNAARATTALLLITALLTTTQHIGQRAQTQSTEQLVDAQTAQQAVHKTAKTQAVEQLADQVQHTRQQQANSRDDLEQRLGEQAPEGVELLLGMRHVGDLLLRVVDGSHDRRRELLEVVGELVLLGGCLAGLLAALCLCGDAAVGIEAAEGAVAVVEDARTFFDEGLDVVDEFFFVELVAGRAVGFLDVLWWELVIGVVLG